MSRRIAYLWRFLTRERWVKILGPATNSILPLPFFGNQIRPFSLLEVIHNLFYAKLPRHNEAEEWTWVIGSQMCLLVSMLSALLMLNVNSKIQEGPRAKDRRIMDLRLRQKKKPSLWIEADILDALLRFVYMNESLETSILRMDFIASSWSEFKILFASEKYLSNLYLTSNLCWMPNASKSNEFWLFRTKNKSKMLNFISFLTFNMIWKCLNLQVNFKTEESLKRWQILFRWFVIFFVKFNFEN